MYGVFWGDDENNLKLDAGDGCPVLSMSSENY